MPNFGLSDFDDAIECHHIVRRNVSKNQNGRKADVPWPKPCDNNPPLLLRDVVLACNLSNKPPYKITIGSKTHYFKSCLVHGYVVGSNEIDDGSASLKFKSFGTLNYSIGSHLLVHGRPNTFRGIVTIDVFSIVKANEGSCMEISFKDYMIKWYYKKIENG